LTELKNLGFEIELITSTLCDGGETEPAVRMADCGRLTVTGAGDSPLFGTLGRQLVNGRKESEGHVWSNECKTQE